MTDLDTVVINWAKENNLSYDQAKALIIKNLDLLTIPNAIVYNRDTNRFEYREEYIKLRGGGELI